MEPDFSFEKKKKKKETRICVTWAKVRPETSFFWHVFKFGSFVFLALAYNDSLQQSLTSSKGKILQKR